MTTQKQYIALLRKLDLTVASQSTARVLGLSVRHCQRLAAGEADLPLPVALLLAMYLRYGIPPEWR